MLKELIENATFEKATRGAHLAARAITHRLSGKTVRNLLNSGVIPEAANVVAFAKLLISTIEGKEKKPLHELSDAKSAAYLKVLSDAVQAHAEKSLSYDKRKGAEILVNLRSNAGLQGEATVAKRKGS